MLGEPKLDPFIVTTPQIDSLHYSMYICTIAILANFSVLFHYLLKIKGFFYKELRRSYVSEFIMMLSLFSKETKSILSLMNKPVVRLAMGVPMVSLHNEINFFSLKR